MTKRKLSTHRITWLILGGAVVAGAPSCGGRAGENSASGGEASTMGASRDEDGDGVVDSLGKTVDRDKDGKPDQIDVDGDGQDDGVAVDTDGDGKPDGAGLDTDGDGIIDAIDTDGDGKPDDVGSGDGDGDTGSGGRPANSGGSNAGGGSANSGGSSSGGGSNMANPGVQQLGADCGNAGALACAGENQKLQLLCDGSKWVANGTCNGAEVCDTSEGNRGSCQEPVAGCAELDPGERYCGTGKEVHSCGPDRLGGETLEECSGRCVDGECLLGDVCPSNGDNFFDCSEECAELADECLLESTSTCGYFTVSEDADLPIALRTSTQGNTCEELADNCEWSSFYIFFKDPGKQYHVELSEGVNAQWDSAFRTSTGVSDGWLDACKWSEEKIVSDCLTVPARIETDVSADSSIVAALRYRFLDGAQNVVVKEGACPDP